MPRPAPHDLEAWTDCPPGTLSELSRSLHRARLRKTVVRVGAPLLVFVLVGLGVWGVNAPTTPSEFTFGGVCCSEVQPKLQQFMAGGLEQDERRAIKAHLDRCPHCQEKMKAMQGQTASLALGTRIFAMLDSYSERPKKLALVANLTDASMPR